MIQEGKEYSANIEILESYVIENINIELDDEEGLICCRWS